MPMPTSGRPKVYPRRQFSKQPRGPLPASVAKTGKSESLSAAAADLQPPSVLTSECPAAQLLFSCDTIVTTAGTRHILKTTFDL